MINDADTKEIQSKILDDILIELLGHGRLPDRKEFRSKRGRFLKIVDQLERDHVLEQVDGKYQIPVHYLRTTPHWNLEGRRTNDVFKALKDRYEQEQDKPQSIDDIGRLSHQSGNDLQRAIYYLTRIGITGGHGGKEFEYTSVSPSELMLNYDNVEQIIDEREGWRLQNVSGRATQLQLPPVNSSRRVKFSTEQLHPNIVSVAGQHYSNGHFREAIFNSCLAVFDLIKRRTGIDKDGFDLAADAFSLSRPRLLLNDLRSESDKNEQAGFILLLQGAYKGIRNPKAHTLVHPEISDTKAFEYLAFLSLLMRRIEEAKASGDSAA